MVQAVSWIILVILVFTPTSPAIKPNKQDIINRSLKNQYVLYATSSITAQTYDLQMRWKKTRPGRNRYLKSRIQYTFNTTSLFQIERVITSGDIETNPGPVSKLKYPCKECQKNVRSNQDAILCTDCDIWSHAKCITYLTQIWTGPVIPVHYRKSVIHSLKNATFLLIEAMKLIK